MRAGLTKARIKSISELKNEPKWMLKIRLEGLETFNSMDNPAYCTPFKIPLKEINYYHKINEIKEKRHLNTSGFALQIDSGCVYYENNIEEVIFCDMDTALKKYPDLIKKYFNKLVPSNDNKYASLSYALWSGGIFLYVPKNKKIKNPYSYNLKTLDNKSGQFEHTIIILEENSEINIVEKVEDECIIHAGVVEVYVGKNSRCIYKTYQNRSYNTYNFVTKRAIVNDNGYMEWLDYNLGSKLNMKYPSCILEGENAEGNIVSLAIADENQIHDIGTKMIHIGKNTKSSIVSKLVSKNGKCNYREKVQIKKSAINSNSKINCETLLLNKGKGDIICNNSSNNTSTIINTSSIIKEDDFDDYKKNLIVDLLKSQIEEIKNNY